MNSLTDNMATFAQILRQLGVRVSSAEMVDAIRSLSLINMTDRQQFKMALKSTLIKSADDFEAFDDAFRMFFVPPEAKQQGQAAWEERKQENECRNQQAETELQFQGKPLELSEELKNVYSRLSEQDRQRLQEFLDKTSKGNNVKENFQPVAENIIKSALSYWQRQLSPEDLAQLANARRQLTGMDEIDRITEAAAGLGGNGRHSLLYKNMQEITEEEIPQVTVLIKRLAQRLNTHISRRYRTTGKHKTVDLRQSIRRNMRYGGMMLSLKHKTKKIHKPKMVVLCDVSA
ncbi:MAG TPA: VWA domain-containing protein, partial [Negativicutes bacterium]